MRDKRNNMNGTRPASGGLFAAVAREAAVRFAPAVAVYVVALLVAAWSPEFRRLVQWPAVHGFMVLLAALTILTRRRDGNWSAVLGARRFRTDGIRWRRFLWVPFALLAVFVLRSDASIIELLLLIFASAALFGAVAESWTFAVAAVFLVLLAVFSLLGMDWLVRMLATAAFEAWCLAAVVTAVRLPPPADSKLSPVGGTGGMVN